MRAVNSRGEEGEVPLGWWLLAMGVSVAGLAFVAVAIAAGAAIGKVMEALERDGLHPEAGDEDEVHPGEPHVHAPGAFWSTDQGRDG